MKNFLVGCVTPTTKKVTVACAPLSEPPIRMSQAHRTNRVLLCKQHSSGLHQTMANRPTMNGFWIARKTPPLKVKYHLK